MIRKLKATCPKTVAEARAAGIKMRLLGTGLFRSGYKIKNSDVVLKFPHNSGDVRLREGIEHSTQEIRRLRRLRAVGGLDQFLPEILYYDKKAGVIAMRYYPEFEGFEEQADAMGAMIGKLLFKIARVRCTDIHTENVRKARWNAVIIDLGY